MGEKIYILSSGGEPVAITKNAELIPHLKEILRACWPQDRVTIKVRDKLLSLKKGSD